MDIQEKEASTNKQSSDRKWKLKKMLYAIAMVVCLLVTVDTARELYLIFSQSENNTPHILIIRKVLALLGWIFLIWYTTDKYFKKNGR